jgi:glycosyltransferase involved in cell wall biosynthesis
MRIVHVAPSYHPFVGGAESHLKAVSEGLARRGHELLVVTQQRATGLAGNRSVALPREEVVNGVRILRLDADGVTPAVVERTVRWPGGYRLARAALGDLGLRDPEKWSAGFRARRAIRTFRPDVVGVVNWYFGGMAAGFAIGRRPGFARVGIPHFHSEEAWSRRPGYEVLIRRYDALLVNTEHERRFIEALAPDGARVSVTGVGVDPGAYAPRDGARLRARLGLGDAPVVGFLGRLDPSKGVVALIDAMRTVWASCPEARLLLAGLSFAEGSKPNRAIAAALSRLAPDARRHVVQLEGLEDRDKGSFFDALDVYAMPSTAESFGIAYLEAWLCRKPVIGANLGSTPFVIRDGVDGLLVDPHDPETVARAISALLADPARRARMGQAGYERTVGERTWDHVTQSIEGVYASLVEARRRR